MTSTLTRFLVVLLAIFFSVTVAAQEEFEQTTVRSGTKIHLGLGPIFSLGASGYSYLGTSFVFFEKGNYVVSIGPWVGATFDRMSVYGDIDIFLKGYYHLSLSKNVSLGLTAKTPVGMTIGSSVEKLSMGFNFGIIPGVEFFFSRNFGIFAELGFFHHSTFLKQNAYYYLPSHLSEGIFNSGIIYRF